MIRDLEKHTTSPFPERIAYLIEQLEAFPDSERIALSLVEEGKKELRKYGFSLRLPRYFARGILFLQNESEEPKSAIMYWGEEESGAHAIHMGFAIDIGVEERYVQLMIARDGRLLFTAVRNKNLEVVLASAELRQLHMEEKLAK